MTRGWFVTGTDTGVGKTQIGCALARLARRRGVPLAVMKPVETGCTDEPEHPGRLRADDAERLQAAAGTDEPPALLCPYRFRSPVSPSVAAREAGAAIDLATIARAADSLREGGRALAAEGAGGLLVPLGGGRSMADLAALLDLPLLVVARAALGTINHTLLTLAEARRRGLGVLGVVLDQLHAEAGPDGPTNAAEIAREGGVPVLGTFPYLPGTADADALADAAERHLDLAPLGL